MKVNDKIRFQNPKSPILVTSIPTMLLKHMILQMSTKSRNIFIIYRNAHDAPETIEQFSTSEFPKLRVFFLRQHNVKIFITSLILTSTSCI